jgi:ubiquinone/menaquinone biosynthesis C-methylase UbiE
MSDGVFDRLAPRCDALRGELEQWEELFAVSEEEGLAAATRLLDVGCGTGSLVELAVRRLAVRAWGVDASAAMLEQARARGVRAAGFKQARAADLPFRDGWFDAATMRLVVHLLGAERPAAFGELARVLAPGGVLHIWTFAAEHIDGFYLASYLPGLRAVDRARFPEPDVLQAELAAAGFERSWTRRHDVPREVDRARAAARLREGYISTISLLDPAEVEEGARGLEAEAAAGEPPLVSVQRWVLVAARR